jgi:hypothetical protein
MLLVFPPLAKACEPPAGIARLAAYLEAHGVSCHLLDANLEGQLWLLRQPVTATDTWSRRALKGRNTNLEALRDLNTYRNYDRYNRVVRDLNRVLSISSADHDFSAGLADFQHAKFSPIRSCDLLSAAKQPELNPFYSYFSQRLPELIKDVTTIGFSLNYLSQALTAFAMIGYVRRCYPSLKIVLGGSLLTSWMRRPNWCNPFGDLLDYLISGPGEEALLKLLGGVQIDKGCIAPDYSKLPLDKYFSPGVILPYSAANGCYWNRCSFCPEQAEGGGYHPVPISQILTDLKLLTEKTEPVLIHLLDNAVSPALLSALAENPIGVPWYCFVRINETLANPEFCKLLKRSGCVMLKLGLESGDQDVLDRMCKGIDLGLASQVLSNLKNAGIAVYCYLLFGTPGETEVEASRTLDFVVSHHNAINFLNLALFNMPIYGEEASEYAKIPFYEGDLSLYTSFTHPRNWDRKKVRNFLKSEFKRHPDIAPIIRNDPPYFSSNHAAFLCGL